MGGHCVTWSLFEEGLWTQLQLGERNDQRMCVELEREVERRGWRSRGLVMPIIARVFDLWILQLAVAVDLRLTGLDTFLIIEKLERLGK